MLAIENVFRLARISVKRMGDAPIMIVCLISGCVLTGMITIRRVVLNNIVQLHAKVGPTPKHHVFPIADGKPKSM